MLWVSLIRKECCAWISVFCMIVCLLLGRPVASPLRRGPERDPPPLHRPHQRWPGCPGSGQQREKPGGEKCQSGNESLRPSREKFIHSKFFP